MGSVICHTVLTQTRCRISSARKSWLPTRGGSFFLVPGFLKMRKCCRKCHECRSCRKCCRKCHACRTIHINRFIHQEIRDFYLYATLQCTVVLHKYTVDCRIPAAELVRVGLLIEFLHIVQLTLLSSFLNSRIPPPRPLGGQ